jgi:hypothetical protein
VFSLRVQLGPYVLTVVGVGARNKSGRAGPANRVQHEKKIVRLVVLGLRGRWCAGRRIVGEKLLVNGYNKRSYESDSQKRTKQGGSQRFRRSSDMGRLANMAGSFILSLSVRMV